jgi:hypothetical protein
MPACPYFAEATGVSLSVISDRRHSIGRDVNKRTFRGAEGRVFVKYLL